MGCCAKDKESNYFSPTLQICSTTFGKPYDCTTVLIARDLVPMRDTRTKQGTETITRKTVGSHVTPLL